MRSRIIALHADPEFKAKTAARMKALNADPEFKAKTAARMKALHADPEFKAKTAARMKALNADPDFRAKCGFLTKHQLVQIVAEIATTNRTYVEIGLDWLITAGSVARIAKQFGVGRRTKVAA
jgi:hypothetical protein